MSVKLALYRAVHNYPGGADALAPQMKLSPNTLRHMADPKKTTHGWSFRRWDEVIALAGTGPLEAHCIEHGGVFVPMGEYADAPAAKVLKCLHRLAKESGDVPRVIEQALKNDGRVSDNELAKVESEIDEMIHAACAARALVRQIHDSRAAVAEEQRP